MNAAIIELESSHDECLYAQIRYLKDSGYTVHLICNSRLKRQVIDFDGVDSFLFFDFDGINAFRSFYKLLQIRNYIIRNRITQVIFNTAEGNLVRNLVLLPFPSKVSFSGIIHNGKKLVRSSSQKIISRMIRKYFVLNDYILPHVAQKNNITVESFYPIFFPQVAYKQLLKDENEIWVCIPGQVELKRRDYLSLLEALKQQKPESNLKFIILGRDTGPDKPLQELVEEAGLQHHFTLFESFIPNDVFHSYLVQSDFIMPLLHPGMPNFDEYQTYKITGSVNLAFAYKKPLLCEENLNHIPDFRENAVFYSLNDLAFTLQQLPQLLQQKAPYLYQHPKWQFGYQQQKYISFIEK